MGDDHDTLDPYAEHLKQELAACGVPADAIQVRYESVIQGYDIVVSCGPLSEAQVACLADIGNRPGHVTFTDDRNTVLEREIGRKGYEAHLRKVAAGLPDLPRYDPSMMSLAEFAQAIERYCGLEPGAYLEVRGDRLLAVRKLASLSNHDEVRRRARLMEITAAALVEHNIQVGVVGGT